MDLRKLAKQIVLSDACWLMAIAVTVAGVVGSRTQVSPAHWPKSQDLGPVEPLSEAALTVAPGENAVIAPFLTTNTPLALYALGPTSTDGILPYNDVAPQAWRVFPADATTFHIIWQEQDNRLRSALIDISGQTIRGPIELDRDIQQYDASSLPDGRVAVTWVDAQRYLRALVVDREGRPGPVYSPLAARIDAIAATADRTGYMHWVWLTSSVPNQWMLHYQADEAPDANFDSAHDLHTFSLTYGEYLTGFRIGLDETHGYVFWSSSTIARPDIEHAFVLSFPLVDPSRVTINPLNFPQDYRPASAKLEGDNVIRYLDRRTPPDGVGSVRWLRPAPEQYAILPVSLVVFEDGVWYPVMAYFQRGALLGEQRLSPRSAEGGPPAATLVSDNELIATWSELVGPEARRYSARIMLDDDMPQPDASNVIAQILGGGLVALPFGLIWLIVPTLLVMFTARNLWTLRFAYIVYGAGKLLWPGALFGFVPPVLLLTHVSWLITPAGTALCELVLALVTLGPLLAGGMHRRQSPRWWVVCAFGDMLLTCAVFGGNLLT